MKPVLIRQHVEYAPPGLLAAWLEARGLAYEVDRSWVGAPLPDPAGYAFVASLGHSRGPGDTHDPAVAAELELLGRAVARGVPVLGLCFGGEALAAVLGGRVERAAVPELGWREIETDDPLLVPAGPWLEWHFESFTTPPGATELARTADATQAFRLGPHLAVQFHPESHRRHRRRLGAAGPRAARGAGDRRRRGAADRLAGAPRGGQGGRVPPVRRLPGAGVGPNLIKGCDFGPPMVRSPRRRGTCTTTTSSRSSPRRTSSAAPRSSGTRTRPASGRTPASTSSSIAATATCSGTWPAGGSSTCT